MLVVIIITIVIIINNIITEGPMRTKVSPDNFQKRTTMTMIVFWISKKQHFSRPLQQKSHTQEVSTTFHFFIRSTVLTRASCYDSGTNGLCFRRGISFRQRQ